MLKDFIEMVLHCVSAISSGALLGVVLTALALGVLCWVACSYYTRLWHKRFYMRVKHHALCGMAALFTVLFTVTFYAVGHLRPIVDEIIDKWSEELLEDNDFSSNTYKTAFYEIKGLSPKDFEGVPEPGKAGSYIPFRNAIIQQTCVEIFIAEACNDFSTLHPFLDKMLSALPGLSEEEVNNDITDYFRQHTGEMYPLNRAIEISARYIREELLEQSPQTVKKTRWILILLFLVVQMIPFGTIGYFAYKDLKIGRNTYLPK